MTSQKWLLLSEAIVYMRTTEAVLRKEMENGRIPYTNFNGQILFNTDQLDQFLLSLQPVSNETESKMPVESINHEINTPPSPRSPSVFPNEYMKEFVELWDDGCDFTIMHRTKGASAQHKNKPRLWIFPTKIQIAPEGKGNDIYGSIREIFSKYFTGITSQSTVHFDSKYFSKDNFIQFIGEVKSICEKNQ